jgi:pyrimidine operon attenuation protein / uracil phosphoribosyltransferase
VTKQRHQSERVLNEVDIGHKVRRLSAEILEKNTGGQRLAYVGIHHRGVVLARRVFEASSAERPDLEFGTLDISLHRDDFDNLGTLPQLKGSDIHFDVEGAHIVLFDDVLFTGRTTRAAIDVLMDYGRPARIELAVLVDRGNRELPIAATYVGLHLETHKADHVKVCLRETDGEDAVYWERESQK